MDSQVNFSEPMIHYVSGVTKPFKVHAPYDLAGDQREAVESLYQGYLDGGQAQTLKGVTGSGKTFTMAKLIEKIQ
ncbi:MAG: DEAD/DEAH box helicase family protein, partial [Spirochaetales bacterium]|nr:DEAD/DEAH box helicase family protein [Candidatus Physcosoma equi]